MSATAASVVPYVRKITPKTIAEILKIDLLNLQRPVQPRVLYDLFGTVFAASIKPDKSGTKQDSIQFRGEFQAVNAETGEALADSGIMYIPVMDAVLYTALNTALERDKKSRIAVALRVSLKTAPKDKPSMTGYEFDVQRLIPNDHSEDDPIARLKALARQHQAALAAPTGAVQNGGVESVSSGDEATAKATAGRAASGPHRRAT